MRQSKFTEEDVEFSCLIQDCGEELAGMGEFLIEAANTISENVSVKMPEIQVIEISDSDDDTPVTNEILSTVQDSAKRKNTICKKVGAITTSSGLCKEISGKMSWMVQEAHCDQFRILQPIQCNYHQFRFLQKNKQHVSDTMSANPKIVQTLPSGKKNLSVYVFELCGKHIKTMPRLFDNLDNHATNPYKCAEYGKIYYSLYILNQHLTANHNGKYNCSECGKHFDICTSLYNHLKIHRDIIYCCQHEGCN